MTAKKRLLHRDKPARSGPPEGVKADPESVTVTAAAATEIKRQASKRGNTDSAMRVSLRGGGCSGFSYHFDWDDDAPRAKDIVLEDHGARVYVDHRSMRLLKGTILDYQRSLMSNGFKFHNPNATSTCGCGTSVSF